MCNDFNQQNLQYSFHASETKAFSAGLKSLHKQSTIAMPLQKHFLKVPEVPEWAAPLWLRQVHHRILAIQLLHFLPSSSVYQNSLPGGLGKCMLSIPNHNYEPLICWVRVVSQKWEMQFSICFFSWPFSTWLYSLYIPHSVLNSRKLQLTIPVTENLTLYFSSRNLQTLHRNSVSIINSIYGENVTQMWLSQNYCCEPEPSQIITFGSPSAKPHYWLPHRDDTSHKSIFNVSLKLAWLSRVKL